VLPSWNTSGQKRSCPFLQRKEEKEPANKNANLEKWGKERRKKGDWVSAGEKGKK